jgi:hypothetical protein
MNEEIKVTNKTNDDNEITASNKRGETNDRK